MNAKGQSLLEYTVLIVIVIGALLTTSHYIKRGVQGRWKTAIDGMGDQYDPRTSTGTITESLDSNTVTTITATESGGQIKTNRTDKVNSTERKIGTLTIGAE